MTTALSILDDMRASDGDASELTNTQVNDLRAAFEDESGIGLWLFAYHICGCKDITMDLHLDECSFLSKWGKLELEDGTWVRRPQRDNDRVKNNWRRLHMCVPRDTFKTTLGTRACALWTALKDPEATIGIFNEAEAKSKSWVGSIKQVIERSRLLHVLWEHVLPPGVHFADKRSIPRNWKWGDSGLVLIRESLNVSELTFEPFGIGGAHTGKHFTHKIYDDIIGEKSSESEAVMQDAIHFVDHGRAIERPSDRGCELVNYTRWAYYDVYKHMLQKWPDDYKVYHRALLENPETGEPDVVDGQSIFPERFPTGLAKKMYEEDPFVFMSQRQCIPQAGRDTAFDKSWARKAYVEQTGSGLSHRIYPEYFDPTIVHADLFPEHAPNVVPLSMMDKAIILDPAPSAGTTESRQQPRARNGIVVVGLDPWGRRHALESRPLREDPVVILENIVEMADYWGLHKVGIEEVNFSKIYRPLWSALLYHKHPDCHIEFVPLKTLNKDKDTRIKGLTPAMKQGYWYFNDAETQHLQQELLEYPHGQTRDLIDALAYTDTILIRPETTQERYAYRERSRRQIADRDPYTGY
jgi:hypothetical protein